MAERGGSAPQWSRSGAFARDLLAPRHWPGWLAVGLLSALCLLPLVLRERLAQGVGGWFARHNAKRRRVVSINLETCFGALGEAERESLLTACFVHYVRSALDLPLVWWASRARLCRRARIEGGEQLDAALAARGRAILLACHHSALELAACRVMASHPVIGIYKRQRNPLLDWLSRHARSRQGGLLAERSDSLRPVVRAVRDGRLLYYLPDEDLSLKDSVFADFFGVPKATLTGTARLARLCDAAVVPVVARYDAATRQYVARFLPALEGFPCGDAQADAERINRALEAMIADDPAQYMWQLRLFRNRPDGGPSLYAE